MKAQLLILVLLFPFLSLQVNARERSQSDKWPVKDHPMMKYITLQESGVTGYSAILAKSNDNELTRVEQQLWDNNSWVSYAKTENIYELGSRVESTGYFKPDPAGEWVINSKEFYTYIDGMLTRILIQGIADGVVVSEDMSTLEIQADGGISTFITTDQYRNQGMTGWDNLERSEFRSENGTITGGSYYEWIDDAWVEYERFTLEEKNGDLVETTSYYDDFSEEWVNDGQIIYPNLTAGELFDRVMEFANKVDDGTLQGIVLLLPDYTAYEWVDDGETADWQATDRQITSQSTELEFGATTATMTSMQVFDVESQWVTTYAVLIGLNDMMKLTGMSFYSMTMESENATLQKVFSEEYLYNENDQLAFVMKYGSWGELFAAKQLTDTAPSGRAVLTWGVNTTIDPGAGEQPFSVSLKAAYPNPFNPSTAVPFQTSVASDVTIRVFDMLGRNVATLVDGFMPAGSHTVQFDASGLSSGIYMIRLDAAGVQQTRSVSLIK